MHSDLVRLANECASSAHFEADVLEHLQRAVGFDVAFFSLEGAEASPTVVGLDAAAIAQGVRGGSAVEREPVKRAALCGRAPSRWIRASSASRACGAGRIIATAAASGRGLEEVGERSETAGGGSMLAALRTQPVPVHALPEAGPSNVELTLALECRI